MPRHLLAPTLKRRNEVSSLLPSSLLPSLSPFPPFPSSLFTRLRFPFLHISPVEAPSVAGRRRARKKAPGKAASQGGKGHLTFPGAIGWFAIGPWATVAQGDDTALGFTSKRTRRPPCLGHGASRVAGTCHGTAKCRPSGSRSLPAPRCRPSLGGQLFAQGRREYGICRIESRAVFLGTGFGFSRPTGADLRRGVRRIAPGREASRSPGPRARGIQPAPSSVTSAGVGLRALCEAKRPGRPCASSDGPTGSVCVSNATCTRSACRSRETDPAPPRRPSPLRAWLPSPGRPLRRLGWW